MVVLSNSSVANAWRRKGYYVCLFSFPGGEAETLGLPMKVREVGWLGFPKQKANTLAECYPWGVLGTCIRDVAVPERCQPAQIFQREPQRLPEQHWLTMGCGMALTNVIGVLSKSPHSYHSSAWKPSFHVPVPSFLSLKGFSGYQRPLGPAVWQARSATEWMFLRSSPQQWVMEFGASILHFPAPQVRWLWGACFSADCTPDARVVTCLITYFTDYFPFSVSLHSFIGIS